MKTKAAILVETGKPLVIDEITIPELKPGQVLVKVVVSGVCHTQILEARGRRGPDPFVPHLLGHEGSGYVEAIGPNVTRVKVGDRVILSWMKGAGNDVPGSVYTWGDKKVNAGGVTTFSDFTVVAENRLTPFPESLPFEVAALIGCALPTGFGSVINTAQVRPGQSVVVVGSGGIGLSAIMAAVLSGAYPVIAVDALDSKLQAAKSAGATHTINAAKESWTAKVLEIVKGGVDVVIEATGRSAIMEEAPLALKNQGGVAVIVGNAPAGEKISIDPKQFNLGKQLRGTWGGDNKPELDFPKYINLMQSKRSSPEIFLGAEYTLELVNQALDDLEEGRAIRPLIRMSHG